MSKEELDYYANYGLIPTLSKDKYNEVKNRCVAGTATPAPGDKPLLRERRRQADEQGRARLLRELRSDPDAFQGQIQRSEKPLRGGYRYPGAGRQAAATRGESAS